MAQPQHGELLVEKADAAWILDLRGEHDLSTHDTLSAQIEAVFAHGTRVVVDLTNASFIDSTVIGVLLRGYQQSQAKPGDALVVVAAPNSQPRRVLDLVGLHDRLPIFQTRQDAVAAIAPQA